jgi:hypothetical protein
MTTPNKNMHWKDIPQSHVVRDCGNHYEAEHYGKSVAVIFWHGDEASEAQAELTRRAKALDELEWITHVGDLGAYYERKTKL